MSLNDFELNSIVMEGLYRNSLVDIDPESSESNVFAFLGKNKKKVILIVNDKQSQFIGADSLQFLIEILKACKLEIEDIALINIDGEPAVDYKSLQAFFKPQTIICFGIDLNRLQFPLEFPEYQVQRYNHQQYLSAPSLEKIISDIPEKQKLWNCLKKLFLI